MKFFLYLLLFTVISFPLLSLATSYQVDIYATVPGCGDGIIQLGEQCDGVDFGGSSCSLLGFSSGSLSCSTVCTLVTDSCLLNTPSAPSTQIRFSPRDADHVVVTGTNLVVTGFFAPFSRVTLLKDGFASGMTFTDAAGFYQITVSGISPGKYILKIVAASYAGGVLVSDSFFGEVFSESTTKISSVYIAPDYLIDRGVDTLRLVGKSVPGAEVRIQAGNTFFEVRADARGDFSYEFAKPVSNYNQIRVGLLQGGDVVWGNWRDVPMTEASPLGCPIDIDVTSDCKVNFVDFSLMLWWYLFNPKEASIDLDGNGKLDLVDFSILAFYWTG